MHDEPSRRERILSVARSSFSRCGFTRVSYGDIAKELNTSKAGVYHHFPTKDALLEAAVSPLVEGVEALLSDPPRGARRLLAEYVDLVARHRVDAAIMASDIAGLMSTPSGKRAKSQFERLALLLAGDDATAEGQARARTATLVAATGSTWAANDENPDTRQYVLNAAMGALRRRRKA